MPRPRRLTGPGALATSALLHAALVASGAWLLSRSLAGSPSSQRPTLVAVDLTTADAVELPSMSTQGTGTDTSRASDVLPESLPAAAWGGERAPRPDMERAGRGGSDRATERALNLADSIDGLTLDRDPMNRLDQSQIQRLRTASERRSFDDRRATPSPMQLSFLASGSGKLAVRRPPANSDPSRGDAFGAEARVAGSTLGGPETHASGGPEAAPGGARAGEGERVRALGVSSGATGQDYRRSASVMLARPMVPQSRAAVPAAIRARPQDTADSSQDVAGAVASLVHASTAGGRTGAGVGGQRGPGAPGSGGSSGPGSRSVPSGHGAGALADVGSDPGVIGYFRGIERKVEPHWRDAFPIWAIAEGRGGLAIVTLVIRRDGTLASADLARPSGVPEFDSNVLAAIRRAAPFGPLPARLGPGPVPVRMAFDATNPAVGRDGPGKGGRPRRD